MVGKKVVMVVGLHWDVCKKPGLQTCPCCLFLLRLLPLQLTPSFDSIRYSQLRTILIRSSLLLLYRDTPPPFLPPFVRLLFRSLLTFQNKENDKHSLTHSLFRSRSYTQQMKSQEINTTTTTTGRETERETEREREREREEEDSATMSCV